MKPAHLLLLPFIVTACLPVPRFVEEPFMEDAAGLKEGLTTKSGVLDLFGEPGATYDKESIFVYTDFHEQVTLVGNAPLASFGELHFLVLSFGEDDTLTGYSIKSSAPDSDGCILDEWCSPYQNLVSRLANVEQDSRAKRFAAAEDRCGIYVAGNIPAKSELSLDGQSMGGIFSKHWFQYWNVVPGSHEVSVEFQPGEKESWFVKDLPSLEFECDGGSLVFLQVKAGWSTFRFETLDQAEGREEIEGRRLIVPGPMRRI